MSGDDSNSRWKRNQISVRRASVSERRCGKVRTEARVKAILSVEPADKLPVPRPLVAGWGAQYAIEQSCLGAESSYAKSRYNRAESAKELSESSPCRLLT